MNAAEVALFFTPILAATAIGRGWALVRAWLLHTI